MCGGGGVIYGYSLDPSTGAPRLLQGSPFSSGVGALPEGMAAVPNSRLLYVADAKQIDAFCVDGSDGFPTPIPGSPFMSGSNPQLVVDPSGKFLYASDDDPPGGILAFTIGPNGALTPVVGSPFMIPGSSGPNSQPYGIVDTGKFVYTALSATNQIAGFSINTETGALTPVPESPFSTGGTPLGLALANNFLYNLNWQDTSISGYSIDANGVLTPVPGSPFLKNSTTTTLTVDPLGKYLFIGTSVGIGGYNIDPSTGALGPGLAGISNDGALWLTVVQLP